MARITRRLGIILWMGIIASIQRTQGLPLWDDIQNGASYDRNENNTTRRVVCFFTNWAQYITGDGSYTVDNIDPFLCTHINYAFAFIEGTELVTIEWNDESMYRDLNRLKLVNPALKTLLSVGGYTMGSAPFEHVTSSPTLMSEFSANVASFLRRYRFDGVDLDWEYPPSSHRDKYTELLNTMRDYFDAEGSEKASTLLLTVSLSASVHYIYSSYDLGKMHQYVDFATVMTYDYHGYWGAMDFFATTTSTGFHSPLYGVLMTDKLCQDWTVKAYIEEGFPSSKFVLGIPVYGRSFTLCDDSDHGVGATACGPGRQAHFTKEKGIMAFNEVCMHQKYMDYMTVYDVNQKVPYCYKGDQWIGFDNVISVLKKIQYAKENALGGVMFWDLAKDDFQNWCGHGPYPLIRQAQSLMTTPTTTTTTSTTTPATTTQTTTTPSTTTSTTTIPSSTTSTTTTPSTTTSTTTTPSTTTTTPSTTTPSTTTSTTTTPSTTTSTTTVSSTTTSQAETPAASSIDPSKGVSTSTVRPTLPPPDVTCEFENQLHPHPEVCQLYYRCSHGEPYLFMCPYGLCFDPFVNACNWRSTMQLRDENQNSLAVKNPSKFRNTIDDLSFM